MRLQRRPRVQLVTPRLLEVLAEGRLPAPFFSPAMPPLVAPPLDEGKGRVFLHLVVAVSPIELPPAVRLLLRDAVLNERALLQLLLFAVLVI